MAQSGSKGGGLRVVGSDRARPFVYGEADDAPEMPLIGASEGPVRQGDAVVQGIDLTGKPKIILLTGRGKTGKTTCALWMVDRAFEAGRELLMADMDPTNPTFKVRFPEAVRPDNIDDAASSLRWLEMFIGHALANGHSAVIDLGGGDATLRRLVDTMPQLVEVVEEAGSSLVLLYFLGPQEDDLSPMVSLEGRGFKPGATGLVLNEGVTELGSDPAQALGRVRRHTAFRAAVARGAVPIRMPRLQNATAIETKRVHFSEAVKTFGPFERVRVKAWLGDMESSWAGVQSWLP